MPPGQQLSTLPSPPRRHEAYDTSWIPNVTLMLDALQQRRYPVVVEGTCILCLNKRRASTRASQLALCLSSNGPTLTLTALKTHLMCGKVRSYGLKR